MIGGFLGGALNGALNGGSFKDIMISGLIGAGFGAVGGGIAAAPISNFAKTAIGVGLLIGGGAYAAATGNMDVFLGGLAGGISGGIAGNKINQAIRTNPTPGANPPKQENQNKQSLKTDQKPEPKYKLVPHRDIEGQVTGYDIVPEGGETVYRQGNFANDSWNGNYVKGQQWAPENPLTTSNYAKKYGLPLENSGKADWVVRGHVQGEYGLRPAPASYNNPFNTGGAVEVLPKDAGKVKLDYFHMPD